MSEAVNPQYASGFPAHGCKTAHVRFAVLLFLLLSLIAPSSLAAQGAKMPTFVSMVQLLSNPERYDGKLVRVVGYVWIEPEGAAIYLHKEDKVNSLTKNAIQLSLPEGAVKDKKQLSGYYVLVEGVFDSNDAGHMGLYSGTLRSIQRTSAMHPQK